MSSHVLVVNAGSSSLKYSLVDGDTGVAPASGAVERIGEGSGRLVHTTADGRHTVERPFANFEEAFRAALDAFDEHGPSLTDAGIEAIGHRVVHGGARFAEPVLVDDALVAAVTALVPLAPLHNPANLEGIDVGRRLFPDVPQVAVFDTAFHQTVPPVAYTYAVPAQWREEYRIRRYGFHGTSHGFVTGEAARLLDKPVEETNLIVLHLGNGASATAVRGGRSVDTSMGFTPLEGLVMGTRSGDLDPAVHAHLHRELGWTLDDVDRALNRESGLKGSPATTTSASSWHYAPRAMRPPCWRSTSTATGSASTSAPTTRCLAWSTPWSSRRAWESTTPRSGQLRSSGWNGSGSRSTRRATRVRATGPAWCRPRAARSR